MMLNAVIRSVSGVPAKPYEGAHGPIWYVEGEFEDGSLFDRGSKSVDNAQRLVDQLNALIGQTESYDVEDSGKQFRGKKKWKLKGYPGMPGGFQGGGSSSGNYQSHTGNGAASKPQPASNGGGGYGGRYRDSEAGAKEERDSIVRQVAVKAAVELVPEGKLETVANVLANADLIYQWIAKPAPLPPPPAEAPAYERYSNEINMSLKKGDMARLDELGKMISASFYKKTLNQDQVAALEDELVDARKAVASAKAQAEWQDKKRAEASAREPLHTDPRIAETLEQAESAF